jgi:signal transduction histidine kinase
MRGPLSSFGVLLEQLKQSKSATNQINETIVQMCDRNLKRLISQIENVLKLERFKLEEIIVRPELVCPADIVRDAIADYSHDATAKGLHVENAVDQSLRMRIDSALFLDTMTNLIQNALKYTHSGSVRVEAEEHIDEVVFKVIDSGLGVPAEQQKTLFHIIQSGQAGGVGIGLLIVHRAVTAQGGTLGVESAAGKGSVFWFCLPRIVKAQN